MPVVLGQAVLVRTRYIELPEPTGARCGSVGSGPPLRLLIVGDSSAVGVGVATQDDALLGQIIARLKDRVTLHYDLVARTGARTADVIEWLNALPGDRYDVVVTALGVNDVTKGVSLRTWLRRQAMLFDRIKARSGCTRIVVSGLPPIGQFPLLPHPLRWVLGRQAARFDRHLHKLVAGRDDCVTLEFDMGLDESNMSADGFHPGPVVYGRWADHVAKAIINDPELLDAARAGP